MKGKSSVQLWVSTYDGAAVLRKVGNANCHGSHIKPECTIGPNHPCTSSCFSALQSRILTTGSKGADMNYMYRHNELAPRHSVPT